MIADAPPVLTVALNPSLDLATATDHVTPDAKLRCDQPSEEPGGGGLNVARVVGELGHRARAVHTAGGSRGRRLGQLLDDAGTERTPVGVDGDTRMNLTVTSRATGEQFRFLTPGPELDAAASDRCLRAVEQAASGSDYVVLSGSLPPAPDHDLYARLAGAVGDGTRVVVDTSGPALRAVLDAGVFLVKPNQRELADLVGEEAGLEEAADRLVDGGAAEVVVLSLGRGGVYLTGRDVPGEHVRAPTVEASSRVGAGDSTVGGIVTGLVRGWSVPRAVRLGVAAGTAAVMTAGTQLCRRDDVERLFARLDDHGVGR